MLQLWRLVNNLSRLPANCFLTECDGLSAIFVRIGEEMTHYERCFTAYEAFHKANELLVVMVELGWTETQH